MKNGIYTASKVKHAAIWRGYRDSGFPINSTWIDEARDKESPSLPDLWIRCVVEAAGAGAVVLYVEPGDHLKGALVEVGAALACGVPVLVVGEVDQSWVHHPLVCRYADLDLAMQHAREYAAIGAKYIFPPNGTKANSNDV